MALIRWQTIWQLVKYSNRSPPLPTCRPYALTPQSFVHVSPPTISRAGPQSVLLSNINPTPSSVRWFSNNNTNSSPSPANDDSLLAQILSNQKKQQEQQRAEDKKENLFLAASFGCWIYLLTQPSKTREPQQTELVLGYMLSKVTKKLSERSGESEQSILDSVRPKGAPFSGSIGTDKASSCLALLTVGGVGAIKR